MDKELEEAQELTKDDLLAKMAKGRPANIGQPRDLNQLAASIVDRAAARLEERLAPRVEVVTSGTNAKTSTEAGAAGDEGGQLLDRVDHTRTIEYAV